MRRLNDELPAGYALLVAADENDPWRKTVLVPAQLALGLNNAREALLKMPVTVRMPDDYAAALLPAPLEVTELEPVVDARDVRMRAEAKSPAAPSPPQAPKASGPLSRVKEQAVRGRTVPVVDMASVNARERTVSARWSSSKADRELELRSVGAVVQRGPDRVVALPRGWRTGLARLRETAAGCASVVDRVADCCALAEVTRRPLRVPPLLLVGIPGVGKTHFALALAQALGMPHFVYNLASAETASTLSGSDKHWTGSEPGALYRLIVDGALANPVVTLDELDKARRRSNGYQPLDELLSLLEPRSAKLHRDKATDIVFDASFVIYVATANRLSDLPASLLSRFEIHHVKEPDAAALMATARVILGDALMDVRLQHKAYGAGVVQQLAALGNARRMVHVARAAAARAVLAGRRVVIVEDLADEPSRDRLH